MNKHEIKQALLVEDRHNAYGAVANVFSAWSAKTADACIDLIEDAAVDPADEELWQILPNLIYLLYQTKHRNDRSTEAVRAVARLASPHRNDSGMDYALGCYKHVP